MSRLSDEERGVLMLDRIVLRSCILTDRLAKGPTPAPIKNQVRSDGNTKRADQDSALRTSDQGDLTDRQRESSKTWSGAEPIVVDPRDPRGRKLKINPEFRKAIRPLSLEERERLKEQLLASGGPIEPIAVWKGHGDIVDGHNRYDICVELGLRFPIIELEFEDEEEAINWIREHQLAKRNLSGNHLRYTRGLLYEQMREEEENADENSEVEDPECGEEEKPTALDRLAQQFKVDPKTILRDADFARNLDVIADVASEDFRERVLNGDLRVSQNALKRIALLRHAKIRKEVEQTLKDGKIRGPRRPKAKPVAILSSQWTKASATARRQFLVSVAKDEESAELIKEVLDTVVS